MAGLFFGALGGGNELAMHCDLIVANETARIGQPEISLGVMPGAGGSQLLALAVGRYCALELCLTGRQATAHEMYDWGLVNRVVPQGQHLDQAKQLAREVAMCAPIAARFIREATHTAFEMPLDTASPTAPACSPCSSPAKTTRRACAPSSQSSSPTFKVDSEFRASTAGRLLRAPPHAERVLLRPDAV